MIFHADLVRLVYEFLTALQNDVKENNANQKIVNSQKYLKQSLLARLAKTLEPKLNTTHSLFLPEPDRVDKLHHLFWDSVKNTFLLAQQMNDQKLCRAKPTTDENNEKCVILCAFRQVRNIYRLAGVVAQSAISHTSRPESAPNQYRTLVAQE